MKTQTSFSWAAVAATLLSVQANAQPVTAAVEFSAEMYQKAPQGQEVQGKIHVGKDRMRTEMTQGGQQMIQIVDNAQRVQWMINPAQRSYMEQRAPADGPAPAPAKAGGNPCEGMPGATCRSLGSDPLQGRAAEKWELTMTQQGQSYTMTQWIDQERGMPLRQEMPNQQIMELKMVGPDTLGGRAVEKWEVTLSQGGKPVQTSHQWYDPELKIAIREEIPGGYVREFRNIQVGPQPAELFSIPAGLTKVEPQPPRPAYPPAR
jgi:outer membrane lipoprotein-sorting protein